MALGIPLGAPSYGQSQGVSTALMRARLLGRPVTIPNPDGSPSSLVAYSNGTIGTPGGGFGGARGYAGVQGLPGTPSGAAVTAPTAVAPSYTDPTTLQTFTATPNPTTISASGPGYGTSTAVPAVMPVQAPLNQANPNTTYVSPNTAQAAGAAPVVGATGTQSGQPVHATYNYPQPAATVAQQAKTYRAAHGLTADDDTAADRLNAESLAAANAGRTTLNRDLAAQYGQPLAAGVAGPRTDVVNALSLPPAASTAVAQQTQPIALAPSAAQNQPIVLAPTAAATTAQSQPYNPLQQGLY